MSGNLNNPPRLPSAVSAHDAVKGMENQEIQQITQSFRLRARKSGGHREKLRYGKPTRLCEKMAQAIGGRGIMFITWPDTAPAFRGSALK